MNTYYQLLHEAPSLVQRAIARGLAKPAPPQPIRGPVPLTDTERAKHRKRALDRYYEKRAAFVAAGLTTGGKVRTRPVYVDLNTLTPEQQLERKRQQKAESYERCALRRAA